MATAVANLNGGASQIFTTGTVHKTRDRKPTHRSLPIIQSSSNKTIVNQETPALSRRASSIGIALSTIFHHFTTEASRADEKGNGWWITAPIPVPTVINPIANKETGTRSFVTNGIYIANIGVEGSAFRLKHYAFDLLALGDLFGQDAWSYIKRYLRLKSTIMYFDFDKVISAETGEQKQLLIDLANRLFDSVEKLDQAVIKKDDSLTQSCYDDATVVLKEVMDRMTA